MKDTSENYLLSESDPLASKQLFHVVLAPGVERLGHHCELLIPYLVWTRETKDLNSRQLASLLCWWQAGLWWCSMLQAVQSLEDGEWQRERGQSQFDWKASARIKGLCWQEGFPETLKGGGGSKNFSY